MVHYLIICLNTLSYRLDCTELADAVYFFFNKLFLTCNLFPLWFVTLSSYALQASLLNSSLPEAPERKLFLPFLNERVYCEYEKRLLGGFSTTQAYYAHFNHARISPTDDMKQNHQLSWASFHDANQLYPTVRL